MTRCAGASWTSSWDFARNSPSFVRPYLCLCRPSIILRKSHKAWTPREEEDLQRVVCDAKYAPYWKWSVLYLAFYFRLRLKMTSELLPKTRICFLCASAQIYDLFFTCWYTNKYRKPKKRTKPNHQNRRTMQNSRFKYILLRVVVHIFISFDAWRSCKNQTIANNLWTFWFFFVCSLLCIHLVCRVLYFALAATATSEALAIRPDSRQRRYMGSGNKMVAYGWCAYWSQVVELWIVFMERRSFSTNKRQYTLNTNEDK